MPPSTDRDPVEVALSIGEARWAIHCAKAAVAPAKKKGPRALLDALRKVASIEAETADDEDLPSLASSAKAWAKVADAEGATAFDHERLAWAELLASKTRKASDALARAIDLEDEPTFAVLSAAVAWAERRKDKKRLATLEDVVTAALAKKKERDANVERLESVVRLLLQSHVDATTLADLLVTHRGSLPVWDPARARATELLCAAHRVADENDRAEAIAKEWANACEKALPKKDDVRRHVLERVSRGDSPENVLDRARRRVARALAVYDAKSAALEMPLYALKQASAEVDEHEVVIDACRKLAVLQATRKSQDDLRERHGVLTDLRRSLTALERFDEALAVADQADELKARMDLHLCPDHYARAEIYEAMGDLDRMVEAHLAAVAQSEAAAPPIYGPGSTNARLARGWARQAMERAGRGAEAKKRFPED